MRIVYPVLWSQPGRHACRAQTMNTLAALARTGHQLTLLMPRGVDDAALDAAELRDYFEVEGDFRVAQRPSRWAGEPLARSLMWLRQAFADEETAQADLLYSRIPAMFGMGQVCPIPFATDHYRPWADELPAIRWSFRATARHPRCAGLILHSEYAASAFRRAGIDEAAILVAHNGADPPAETLSRAEARARLGLDPARATAIYAGRVNVEKGLDQILALAALRPAIQFVLVGAEGDGPISAQAATLDNVRLVDWVAPAVLPIWLQAADVLLIPPSRAPLDRFRNCVLPMKLYAYLAAGRPILAPRAPDTAELLVDGDNALLVPPDEPVAAADGLDRLLADDALAGRLGAAARALSADLSWDRRARRISGFLETRLAAAAASGQNAPGPAAVSA